MFSDMNKVSRNFLVGLEKSFRVAVARAKAVFSGRADDRLNGTAWIESLTGESKQPLRSLNQYCLENRVNGVCLTRYTIHLFRENNPKMHLPHNTGSMRWWKIVIDSW